MRVLAGEIGSRPSNSPNAWRTAGYIREQLAAAGYEAQFQSYNFGYFQDRFSQLILSAPERVQVTVRPFQYSGSGSVAGQLVDCGLGRPTDCPTKRIDNELALVARDGTITLQEKVANVVAKGASAVVVYNDRNGELRGALTAQAKVPAVGITRSDGQQLQQYVRQGKTSVELTVDVRTDSLPGNNVVAGTPGQSIGRRVVIGAHYDSTAMGPGANDNGSGVATLLELARVMRNQKYAFDPIFVAFGDEEVGLVGSRKYLEALSTNQKSQTSAMLNLDMIGVGDSMQFGGTSTLYARAIRTASDMGYRATAIGTRLSASSDHASFQDAGIPAVHFYRAEDPYYHTALDTLDRVQPENMEAAARVALALLDQIGRGN